MSVEKPNFTVGGDLEQNSPTETSETDVPKGYFRSSLFVGTVIANAFGQFTGPGAYSIPASILSVINEDIGPDPNYFWISIVNTLVMSVGNTLLGRLTDIFGRRYFVIGGNVLGLIGSIVASRALTISTLIGANVLMGCASTVQIATPLILGELVPLKHRYLTSGAMYLPGIPATAFGPAIAWGFVLHTSAGWRWCYYLMIITNSISTVCAFLFYHPPTFEMKNKKTRLYLIRHLDWIGLTLFCGGLSSFLIGISWGGVAYPWHSARVITTLVVGVCALVSFALWETFATLEQPLVPIHLFKNLGWVAVIVVMAFASSCYYGFAIIWPQMVFGLYTTDRQYGAMLCCAVTGGYLLGVVATAASGFISKQKVQAVVAAAIATPLLGAVACATVDNKTTVLGLITTGTMFIGYVEGLCVVSSGLALTDQSDIGAGMGVSATFRNVGAAISTAIYVAVLRNRSKHTVPEQVIPAIVGAGLPAASIPEFLEGLSTGSFSSVSGVTPAIIEAGTGAYRFGLVLAFRMVFYTCLAFLLTNTILCFFFPNLDNKLTASVAAKLHKPRTLGILSGPIDTEDKQAVDRQPEHVEG